MSSPNSAEPEEVAEMAALAHLTALFADTDLDELVIEQPPADLWASIAAAISQDEDKHLGQQAHEPQPHEPLAGSADNVVSLATGRSRPERMLGRRLLAAAAVVLLVALVGVGLLQREDSETLVASVALSPEGLDAAGAGLSGSADVLTVDDGYEVAVQVSDLAPLDDGYYELWIIDPEVSGMHSLGSVTADGRYVVPNGVRVEDFPIVDISIEHPDGDPTHSGQSVLRGKLNF